MDSNFIYCHICSGQLQPIITKADSPLQVQVTSDCRPWRISGGVSICSNCGIVQKPVTTEWKSSSEQIYAGYRVYAQGGGKEQSSFNQKSGESQPRSEMIVNWLRKQTRLSRRGLGIDIGCGNGSFLRTFLKHFPHWTMIGSELDNRNKLEVEAIKGVRKLHTGSLSDLHYEFDLVVMVHALEHIPGPIQFLKDLRMLWEREDVLLLIQVPDLDSSPFDLVIADHCSHFTMNSLRWVIQQAGWDRAIIDNHCVPKELTALAQKGRKAQFSADEMPSIGDANVRKHLAWLSRVMDQARSVRGQIGIFGSSISSTWLAEVLRGRVAFFVDEDTSRVGQQHLGRPIIAIDEIQENAQILMPMRLDMAKAIADRLGAKQLNLLLPPE
jgi:cyclopropane fatty-acyl-phospholipid synthase-like methyltransferase